MGSVAFLPALPDYFPPKMNSNYQQKTHHHHSSSSSSSASSSGSRRSAPRSSSRRDGSRGPSPSTASTGATPTPSTGSNSFSSMTAVPLSASLGDLAQACDAGVAPVGRSLVPFFLVSKDDCGKTQWTVNETLNSHDDVDDEFNSSGNGNSEYNGDFGRSDSNSNRSRSSESGPDSTVYIPVRTFANGYYSAPRMVPVRGGSSSVPAESAAESAGVRAASATAAQSATSGSSTRSTSTPRTISVDNPPASDPLDRFIRSISAGGGGMSAVPPSYSAPLPASPPSLPTSTTTTTTIDDITATLLRQAADKYSPPGTPKSSSPKRGNSTAVHLVAGPQQGLASSFLASFAAAAPTAAGSGNGLKSSPASTANTAWSSVPLESLDPAVVACCGSSSTSSSSSSSSTTTGTNSDAAFSAGASRSSVPVSSSIRPGSVAVAQPPQQPKNDRQPFAGPGFRVSAPSIPPSQLFHRPTDIVDPAIASMTPSSGPASASVSPVSTTLPTSASSPSLLVGASTGISSGSTPSHLNRTTSRSFVAAPAPAPAPTAAAVLNAAPLLTPSDFLQFTAPSRTMQAVFSP